MVIEAIREQFDGIAIAIDVRSPTRLRMEIPASAIRTAASSLRTLGARFATMSGVEVRDGIEINYHFCFDAHGIVLTVACVATWPEPIIDSIAQDLPAALWIEREIRDLLGVEFRGHPDMRRLILPDDWPEGSYPLRREFTR